ncbi:conserved hypothetical protein [Ricinus communis]|uniref:RING-type E3 ubiquitin transferase n=1 Tax=Ricinus communis TaxID=3988 RepID=B9T2M7_RICCO|nr:conserved hypothetical protein [Ricinus communis]
MAGMLPGVECARRRRFHQSSDSTAAAAYGGSTRRRSSTGNLSGRAEGRPVGEGELQTEVYGLKKSSSSGSKLFNWAKLSWKAADQDECTICLERFKSGETLVHLPCAHKYHCRCLVPWLENNAHCPCCRMEIHVQFS